VTKRWGEIDLGIDQLYSASIGRITVQLIQEPQALRYSVDGAVKVSGWRTVQGSSGITLRPATADLPVVILPDEPISIFPGASVFFDVHLPVWLQVVSFANTRAQQLLLDIPSESQKRTWFGSPEAGEPAYVFRFKPFQNDPVSDNRLRVPLQIKNSSPGMLWFDRFLLRVNQLDIAVNDDSPITNEVTVTFKGTDQFSQISIGEIPEYNGAQAAVMTPRRLSGSADFLRKSFLFLRDLTG